MVVLAKKDDELYVIKVYMKDLLFADKRSDYGINRHALALEYKILCEQDKHRSFIGSLSHVFMQTSRYYFVMPFVRGGTMKKVL